MDEESRKYKDITSGYKPADVSAFDKKLFQNLSGNGLESTISDMISLTPVKPCAEKDQPKIIGTNYVKPATTNRYCTNCFRTKRFYDHGTHLTCETCSKHMDKTSSSRGYR